jgi:hypothetical protein
MSHVAVAAAAAVAAADDESDGSDAEWAGQFGEMLLFSGSSSSCSSDGADEGGGGGADVAARWRRRRQSPGGRPPSPCSRSPEVVPESTADDAVSAEVFASEFRGRRPLALRGLAAGWTALAHWQCVAHHQQQQQNYHGRASSHSKLVMRGGYHLV